MDATPDDGVADRLHVGDTPENVALRFDEADGRPVVGVAYDGSPRHPIEADDGTLLDPFGELNGADERVVVGTIGRSRRLDGETVEGGGRYSPTGALWAGASSARNRSPETRCTSWGSPRRTR